DDPTTGVLVPADVGHLGLEARVVVQPEVLADVLAVLEDLGRVRVLLLGHVADFFEQRQVDVGLDVAHRARVAVPVPRAAEVAALLDDAHVVDAGFVQTRPRHYPTEAAADYGDLDAVGKRRPVDGLDLVFVHG